MLSKTKIFLLVFLLFSLSLLVTGTLGQSNRLEPKQWLYDSTVYPASLNAILAGCGETFDFNTENKNFGTVPLETKSKDIPRVEVVIPSYGYMVDEPFLEENVKAYPKDFEGYQLTEVMRALWQGYDIVWVDTEINDSAYEFASDYVTDWNKTHSNKVILLPWLMDYTPMPGNRMVAYSSWGQTQTCEGFSESVFEEFEQFESPNKQVRETRDFDAPPAAEKVDGKLRSVLR